MPLWQSLRNVIFFDEPQIQTLVDQKTGGSVLFVSYAQNFEDAMLRRALKGVAEGFYIDLGAMDPKTDSVTKAFYDLGWRGINVEPSRDFFQLFAAARPHDINLQVAVGKSEGSARIFVVEQMGLSTLVEQLAAQRVEAGWSVKTEDVPCTTLAAIWTASVPPGQEVHFPKIDVEGSELSVPEGNNWALNRPWIVLLEATVTNSPEENHATWEHVLTAAHCRFVYADGFNRFYVADEWYDQLVSAFKYPPNVFDQFEHSATVAARMRATELSSTIQVLAERLDLTEAKYLSQEERHAQLQNQFCQCLMNDLATAKAKCLGVIKKL